MDEERGMTERQWAKINRLEALVISREIQERIDRGEPDLIEQALGDEYHSEVPPVEEILEDAAGEEVTPLTPGPFQYAVEQGVLRDVVRATIHYGSGAVPQITLYDKEEVETIIDVPDTLTSKWHAGDAGNSIGIINPRREKARGFAKIGMEHLTIEAGDSGYEVPFEWFEQDGSETFTLYVGQKRELQKNTGPTMVHIGPPPSWTYAKAKETIEDLQTQLTDSN
jgi:hypothetical protein